MILCLEKEIKNVNKKQQPKSLTLNFLKQSTDSPLVTTLIAEAENDVKINLQTNFEEATTQKIGIKDLCSEDKARIANLVKELAK